MQRPPQESDVRQTVRTGRPAPHIRPAQDSFVSPGHLEDGAIGEAQAVRIASGLPRLLLTVTINALVLVEVFIAMYFAAKTPDEITPVFFKVLFSLLIPTLFLSFIAKRLISRREKP